MSDAEKWRIGRRVRRCDRSQRNFRLCRWMEEGVKAIEGALGRRRYWWAEEEWQVVELVGRVPCTPALYRAGQLLSPGAI
jgi:hypothetical protein